MHAVPWEQLLLKPPEALGKKLSEDLYWEIVQSVNVWRRVEGEDWQQVPHALLPFTMALTETEAVVTLGPGEAFLGEYERNCCVQLIDARGIPLDDSDEEEHGVLHWRFRLDDLEHNVANRSGASS